MLSSLKQYLEIVNEFHEERHVPLCMEGFVLKYGREFTNITHGQVRMGKKQRCYQNAFDLANCNKKYMYCEGYAISSVGIPLMHAWCIDKDNGVYDPTWDDGVEYYGVPFRTAYVLAQILRKKTYGVIDDWESGFPLVRGRHKPEYFLYRGIKRAQMQVS